MATYALIHGAYDVGWYWHLVERELHERGHRTVAPDLPIEDDDASLVEDAPRSSSKRSRRSMTAASSS